MRCLEARGIGRDAGVAKIPNVCAAILFDLKCGRADVRPDAEMGFAAASAAFADAEFTGGNFGAGTGATVGTLRGAANAMKGGLGKSAYRRGELLVGAVAAVNCAGDVVSGGKIIAGALNDDKKTFADSERVFLSDYFNGKDLFSGNTVLVCIITNAKLEKAAAAKLAALGQNGIARAIRPAHTSFDGDTVFAMCSGEVGASADAVGILAAKAVEDAILDAVNSATSAYGYPSAREMTT
jgi:L-aminopeptidase/D-esterase-like protein